jgi:DNA-binding PadR family transcriptional regulator
MTRQEPRLSKEGLRVLAIFHEAGGRAELCGADIRKATGIRSGTLYPILLRFEEAGWLTSRWEKVNARAVGRPRKRLYKISGAGAAKVREVAREFEPGRIAWAFS